MIVLNTGTHSPQTIKPPEKKKSNRLHYVLIGILLILFVASGITGVIMLQAKDSKGTAKILKAPSTGITSTPTPVEKKDPTLDWQTYANKSIQFKYPDRFTIQEPKPGISQLYPKIYAVTTFTDEESTITITIAKNSQNYTLDQAVGNGPSLRYGQNIISNKEKKALSVDGTKGILIEKIPSGEKGIAADALFVAYGKVYQLTLAPETADQTTFNYLLQTIKFLDQEPADITDNWKLYIDNTYGFSFRYPTNYALEFNKVASGAATLTTIYDNSTTQVDTPKFKVEVQDLKNFGQSAVTSRAIIQKPLQEFVTTKWDYNKAATDSAYPNKTISAISQTTVDGKTAYQFSVTGKYQDDHVAEKLSEEYLFIFTENAGYKYKIWFPKSDPIDNQILKTIIFTK